LILGLVKEVSRGLKVNICGRQGYGEKKIRGVGKEKRGFTFDMKASM
jgi:hypothetical protein